MSTLIISFSALQFVTKGGKGAQSFDEKSLLEQALPFVFSHNEHVIAKQGNSLLTAMPTIKSSDTLLAVLPAEMFAWHSVVLPKIQPKRMREALNGIMEERVLGSTENLHFALAPQASAKDRDTWLAVCAKTPILELSNLLRRLFPGTSLRLVPEIIPSTTTDTAVIRGADGNQEHAWIWRSSAQGVHAWPLEQIAHAPEAFLSKQSQVFAEPALLAKAETLLNEWTTEKIGIFNVHAHLLSHTKHQWNLCQFDLAPPTRLVAWTKGEAIKRYIRSFLYAPELRWLRIGLGCLLIGNIIGLNLYAWHQSRLVQTKQNETIAVLQSTFPNIKTIIDAPSQMERELEQLRGSSATGQSAAKQAFLASLLNYQNENPQGRLSDLHFVNGKLENNSSNQEAPQ